MSQVSSPHPFFSRFRQEACGVKHDGNVTTWACYYGMCRVTQMVAWAFEPAGEQVGHLQQLYKMIGAYPNVLCRILVLVQF